MSNRENPEEILLSGREVAALAGRTDRWVRSMAQGGHFEKDGRGRYRLDSVVRGLISHYEAIIEKGSKSAASSRVTDARTREIELRIAQQERTLIPVEDAEMALSQFAGVVNAELSGLPARMGRDMAVRRKAEAEVHGSRERISAALDRLSEAARSGRDLDEAGP